MARRLDEQDNLDFFNEKYARPRSDARREVERAVLGDEVGLNGYTTVEQAQALTDHLSLLATTRLIDVGAGHGWPGSYLARSSGCRLVATDIPLDALRAAPRTTGELCKDFEMSRFGVMKHLAVLVDAGVVLVERRGRDKAQVWRASDSSM